MPEELLNGLRSKLLRYLAENLRRSNELLKQFVERIIYKHPKSTVLLIGSRARDDHLPHSDYDVLIIIREVNDKIKLVEELRKLKPLGLNLDLMVITLDELEDPITKQMISKCKVLYDGLGIKPILET